MTAAPVLTCANLGDMEEVDTRLMEQVLRALREEGFLEQGSDLEKYTLLLPEAPPLDIPGTINYRAALTIGHPELGIIFIHDDGIFRNSLEHSSDDPLENSPDKIIGFIKLKTENLLRNQLDLVEDFASGKLILPVSYILFGFNTSRFELPPDIYRGELGITGVFKQIKSNNESSRSGWEKLFREERHHKLNIAGSVLTGTITVRKRIEAPKELPPEGSIADTIRQLQRHIAASDHRLLSTFLRNWEGIQRIRGLAGSGKTAMLALKAFHLHYRHPDWNIIITYYSRSLYAQFEKILNDLAAYFQREINPEKIRVMHAWGGRNRPGLYSTLANKIGEEAETFSQAKTLSQHGKPQQIFAGAVDRLVKKIEEQLNLGEFKPEYDAILIDEAQDMPKEFFRMVWLATKKPKRIAYAYDEMQNLAGEDLPGPNVLFGDDATFHEEGENDIWLEKVYRTNRFVLLTAHALGFGIYRKGGQVQAFDPPRTWLKIGYQIKDGKLDYKKKVVLERSSEAHDSFSEKLFTESKIGEFIHFRVFESKKYEIDAILQQLSEDLKQGVSPKNIIIVAYEPTQAAQYYNDLLRRYQWLRSRDQNGKQEDLDLHLVGNITPPEQVFKDNSIAIMHIYRAKGLEAPIVYVVGCEDAESLGDPVDSRFTADLLRRRNFIFTAITRAHGWVRIFGSGKKAETLRDEFRRLKEFGFAFDFVYPSKEEVKKMHAIRVQAKEEEYYVHILNIINKDPALKEMYIQLEQTSGRRIALEFAKRLIDKRKL